MSVKLQNQLVKKIERELTKCEMDRDTLYKRLLDGKPSPDPQVPPDVQPSSTDHKRLGYFESLARQAMDTTADALEDLRAIAPDQADTFGNRVGALALDAFLQEMALYGTTSQRHLPADHRRTAASYIPILRRIGDLPLATPDRHRWQENTIRLTALAESADPTEADQVAELKTRRAKIRRERTIYEILILLFFVGVVATILIMKKSATPPPLGIPGR